MSQQAPKSQEQPVIHNTFVIERSYPKRPETVFSAFADPARRRRWFAEGRNHDVDEFKADFRLGGTERLVYRLGQNTPFPGTPLINEGIYVQIIPNSCIVMSSAMDLGGRRISASLLTILLVPSATGTDLICTHQGAFFEGSGGPEMREAGWRSLFDNLDAELAR
jgi:uncharacterized protein YndB with AHSA1/START domain